LLLLVSFLYRKLKTTNIHPIRKFAKFEENASHILGSSIGNFKDPSATNSKPTTAAKDVALSAKLSAEELEAVENIAQVAAFELDAAAHKLEHEEAVRVADKADFDFWVAAKIAAVKSPCTVRVRIYLVALLTAHFFVSGKMRGAAKRCGVVPGRCES